MLFAGWEVRIVKNCGRGLENAARGRSIFKPEVTVFSLYGPTLSQQITSLFFSCGKLAYKWVCLRNFVIGLAYKNFKILD